MVMSDKSAFKSPDEIYFANKEASECASTLLVRADSFYNALTSNQYVEKLYNMWRAYHGAYADYLGSGHRVVFTGEQGELVNIPINHFRNLAQHILAMITANRPVMETRAINTDYKSYAQTILANGVLDYYMREKGLEDAIKKACELSIVLGAGFIKLAWNATGGDVYEVDPDTQEPIYEGELEFQNLTPLDVVFDGTKENYQENEWVLCRTFKNRYDLIAKYPDLKDKILAVPSKMQSNIYRLAVWSNDDTDDIPVYEFYHKSTEAVPEGRYMQFLSAEATLIDTKMPYRNMPVFRVAPSDILGTPYGYSPMFDVFPIQEGINSLYGTIMTNQNAFGVQNIYVPRGADIAVGGLSGGLNLIEANAKPEPINLTQTPPEVFKFLDMLIQASETISGVNSVVRGNPEASLKSGTALALVQSQALQFISGLQQSYVKLIENVGTSLINILKDFSKTPKLIKLVGKNNRPLMKEFTGDKIADINRVVVDMGNPLSKTIAGRVQMAEQMMQMKIIKDPMQYIQVMNTGRLEAIYEGDQAELLLIKSENEQMLDGEVPLVSPLDQHSLHIQEHRAVIADPDLRKNPSLVKTTMDHIEAHMNALRNTDPALLQMIGEQPQGPVGGSPASPDQQQPPQGALQGSPMGPEMSPQAGQISAGQDITGPGIQNIGIPQPAQVPANLLPNPALQEQAMGNVKQ
jgi:hypothetical protein